MPEHANHQSGLSLLEVLLSLFILSCGLLPLSGMVLSSLQQLRDSDVDSRLLLASMNLAEARQLSASEGDVPAIATLAATAEAQLRQTQQTLWPGQQQPALICRHPGLLFPATTLTCQQSGIWWLQLAPTASRRLLLPLE